MLSGSSDHPIGRLKGLTLGHLLRLWGRLRAPSDTDRSAQRWRRIFLSMGGSLGSRVLAMICTLLTVPIGLRYLGVERYGMWMALTGFVNLLSFFDFGIGIGLQNRVAEMMSRGALDQAATSLRSTFLMLLLISCGLFGVFMALISLTDLPSAILPAAHFGSVDAKRALLIIIGAFVLGLPLGLFSRMAFGLQQGWIASVTMTSGTVMSLLAVLLASRLGLGFETFIAVTVVPPIAAQAVAYLLLSRHVPNGLGLLGPASASEGLSTLRSGARYILPQIGGVIASHSPLVLLGTLSSPVNAAIYAVLLRISAPFQQLPQIFFDQVWPAITEALYRGDTSWLTATLRRLLRMNVAYGLFTIAAIIGIVRLFFPALTGKADLVPSTWIVVLYAVHVAVMCNLQGFAYMTNGLTRMRMQNVLSLLSIVFAFTLYPFAAGRFGIEGLLTALILLNGVVAIPLLYCDCAEYLSARHRRPGSGVS